jgi:hypothetical protein
MARPKSCVNKAKWFSVYSASGATSVERTGLLHWVAYDAVTGVIRVSNNSYDHDRTCYLRDLEPIIEKSVLFPLAK